MSNRRHRARRNPFGSKQFSIMGIQLPPVTDLAAVAAGLVGTPILTNYIFNNYVAGTSFGTSKWAYLGTEAVAVLAPAYVVRRFVNVRVGNMLLLGGAARLVLDLVQTLAPTLIPTTAMPTGLTGMGSQPFLGVYEKLGQPNRRLGMYYSRGANQNASRMITGVPDRLDPSGRF
jgi:hypothetical protein